MVISLWPRFLAHPVEPLLLFNVGKIVICTG